MTTSEGAEEKCINDTRFKYAACFFVGVDDNLPQPPLLPSYVSKLISADLFGGQGAASHARNQIAKYFMFLRWFSQKTGGEQAFLVASTELPPAPQSFNF